MGKGPRANGSDQRVNWDCAEEEEEASLRLASARYLDNHLGTLCLRLMSKKKEKKWTRLTALNEIEP